MTPSPTRKRNLQDDLFAFRDYLLEENHAAVTVLLNRLADDEPTEWMTGFVDRGQRLLEQLEKVIYGEWAPPESPVKEKPQSKPPEGL